MYPLLISAGLGLVVALSLIFIPDEPGYFWGPLLGTVAFVPTFVILSRAIGNRVHPYLERAQRAAQSGNVPQAVLAFEEARAYQNWQLFLGKQIETQIGILHYGAGDEKKAAEHLAKGYPKLSEGPLILGVIHYRAKRIDDAIETLETGTRYNKKSPILYNVLAWIQEQEGRHDAAIATLERGLKALKTDEDTADNLERLRQNKRMNLRGFGNLWYMLKFEHPPGTAHAAPMRKGFRQPPKQRGGKKNKR